MERLKLHPEDDARQDVDAVVVDDLASNPLVAHVANVLEVRNQLGPVRALQRFRSRERGHSHFWKPWQGER